MQVFFILRGKQYIFIKHYEPPFATVNQNEPLLENPGYGPADIILYTIGELIL
jgi:hypothetical protein